MTFGEYSSGKPITMNEFCMMFCYNVVMSNKRYQRAAAQCSELLDQKQNLIDHTTIRGLKWNYLKHFANHFSFENSSFFKTLNEEEKETFRVL